MVPAVRTDQVTRGLSRFTQLFKNQPNCKAILTSLLTPFPELESVAWSVINTRILSTLVTMVAANENTADQLDIIGALVGEARGGRSDKFYLPAIQVRIRVNRSQGGAEDVIQVANLLAPGAATYTEYPQYKFKVHVDNLVPDPGTFAGLLYQTKAAGSGMYITYTTWTDGNDFEWDDSVAGGTGEAGWGDSVAGLVGGLLASAQGSP